MPESKKRRGRGEGSIRYRTDTGMWEGRISLIVQKNGEKRRERPTVLGESKTEVVRKLRAIQAEARDGGARFADRKTPLADYLTHWLGRCKTTRAPNTFLQYEQHCRRHLIPLMGDQQTGKVGRLEVEILFADLQRNGVSRKLQRKICTTLSAALGAAVKDGLLSDNPCRHVELPKTDDAEKVRAYSLPQVRKLLASARSDRLFALFLLGLDSGLRQEELFALEWMDLDFDARTVRVTKALEEVSLTKRTLIGDAGQQAKFRVKAVKTKQGRRTLSLAPETMEALKEHRARMADEGHESRLVFANTTGGFLAKSNVRNRCLLPVLERAELPNYGLHALRHTCATMLLLDGVSVKVVSHRLGHSTARQTLDCYAHLLPDSQEIAARSTSALLGAALRDPGGP
jgi:integrase